MAFGMNGSGGRNSAVVSSADDKAALPKHTHRSPLQTLRKMGDKMKHHTSVTTTEEEPGVSDHDRPAGTAVPVAERARPEALNAGFQPPDTSQRRSFSSFRSFRSKASTRKAQTSSPRTAQTSGAVPGSPGAASTATFASQDAPHADGTTHAAPQTAAKAAVQTDLKPSASSRTSASARTSAKDSAAGGRGEDRAPRIANTETVFTTTDEQTRRQQEVREYLKNEKRLDGSETLVSQNGDATNGDATNGDATNGGATNGDATDGNAARMSSDTDARRRGLFHSRESSQPSFFREHLHDLKEPHRLRDTLFRRSHESTRSQETSRSANGNAGSKAPSGAQPGAQSTPSRSTSLSQHRTTADSGYDKTAHFSASELREETSGFEDAPDVERTVTASQPSAEAAGSLSPRNRFIGHTGSTPPNERTGEASRTTSRASRGPSSLTKVTTRASEASKATGATDAASGVANGANGTVNEAANGEPVNEAANGEPNDESQNPHDSLKTGSDEAANGAPLSRTSTSSSEASVADKDEDLVMPTGVPGLGLGDEDPLLPGEKRTQKKAKKVSPDLETPEAKKRFLSSREKAKLERERQAEYAGWRQIGGWDPKTEEHTKEESEDLLQRSTMLESFISEKFFGDWYQNTAIIVFTAFFAWVLGRMRFSVSWLSLVLLFTATAYRTSVRRMRRNYRDDIVREQLLDRHEKNENETMEWLNGFLVKFWLIFEPSLSQMITAIGNEVLQEQTPPLVHSMKLDKFTLGTKAPRIDFVRGFPKTNARVVVIDMGVSFTPNDTLDLTARQLMTKVNPKIQLGVRIGKGFLTKNLPVLLEDMNFRGKFRLRMRLMDRMPHIQTVDFSFLQPPSFDFVLKPIGGDKLGLDINIIPGLSKFIKDMVDANLGPMFYAPNAFQINVEQLMAGVGVMSGVGVLSIEILSADGLKKDADGRVDPYVLVRSKNNNELAHTKIKCNTTEPVWNETVHAIITNSNETVLLEVYDFDESSPDRMIGQLPIRVSDLNGTESRRAAITSGGRVQGHISYIAHYAPVHMPTEDDDDAQAGARDTKSGILSLKVLAARDLDATISKTAKLSPYAEIEFDGRLVASTKVAKDTNDPEWNYSGEHIVLDKISSLITVRVRDNRRSEALAPQVGIYKTKLSNLLVESEKGRQWFTMPDGKGDIKIDLQWKPANVSVGGSTNNYVEPVGVIRLTIKNAKDLRNLEHLGKIDPYTRVFLGKRLVARTEWFKNELNPVWDEVLYIPVENELQDLTLEVMDVEERGRDRSLGAFKLSLDKIIRKDAQDNYLVFVSDKSFTNKLMLPNRGPKGVLEYAVEFYPAIPVAGPQQRERMLTDKKLIETLRKKIEEQGGDTKKALTDREHRELLLREERLDFSGVDMPVEEQLKYPAGVFVFAITSLEGHHVGQTVRVFANNAAYPIYASEPIQSSKRWTCETCPDFVSAQMYLSNVRVEIGTIKKKAGVAGLTDVEDADGEFSAHDRYAGEINFGCFELLREAFDAPKIYEMKNGAKIGVQGRFFPLPGLKPSPEEDMSDRGCIQVDLEKAVGIAAADRSGLSDPYCAFYLNNDSDRVFKSKTPKQTLNPVWNESFRFAVENVKESFVKAIVNDWDMGNADDFLGGYKFEFSELEPLVWKNYEVPLEYIKKNRETRKNKEVPGTLYLRMRFLPGQLEKKGDHFLIGADAVARTAGGLVAKGVSGGSAVIGTPQHLFNKITGREEQAAEDPDMVNFSANLTEITGLSDIKNEIQVRFYLLGEGEREVYKTSPIKLENGDAVPNVTFEFRALPLQELGVKVLSLKSLGRHSDITQTSTDLEPGNKEIRINQSASLMLAISQDSE